MTLDELRAVLLGQPPPGMPPGPPAPDDAQPDVNAQGMPIYRATGTAAAPRPDEGQPWWMKVGQRLLGGQPLSQEEQASLADPEVRRIVAAQNRGTTADALSYLFPREKLINAAKAGAAGMIMGPHVAAADALTELLPEDLQAPAGVALGSIHWKPGMKLSDIDPDLGAKLIPREKKRLAVPDVQRYLEDRVQKTVGPVSAEASDASKMRRLMHFGRKEFADQLTQPETGVGWYGIDTAKGDQMAQSVFPELADPTKNAFQKALSAVMSNNSKPPAEARSGLRVYQGYRETGELPMTQPSGKEWPAQGARIQLAKIDDMMKYLGGEKAFVDFLRSPQRVRDVRQFRKGTAGKADDLVPGAVALGPKIGRYFMDLLGMPHSGSTVDVWDVRGQQRRLGTLFDAYGRPIAVPRTEGDRNLFMDTHARLGQEHNLPSKESQSVLWHYEKDLYKRLGLSGDAGKRSTGINRFLQEYMDSLRRLSPPQ